MRIAVSLVIPGYNNLRHLKNVYASVKKHAPYAELVLLDDGSTDGTWEWIQQQDCIGYRSEERVGHTVLYDKGIELATGEVVGILHADMMIGPNYIENLLKHLKKGTVVCATRIEPPLHPEGNEKIIRNFGMDFDDLNVEAFENFCKEVQSEYRDITTRGMFAPWILYKEDFQAIGGHDPLFAPFPYEDSDIFQRWILAGYELVQSRDALVYHLTCRGHRWTEEIGKNDNYFQKVEHKARRNYLRKWGSWVANDSYQYPIIKPRYDVAIRVFNATEALLRELEPWCNTIYVDLLQEKIDSYIQQEQPNTAYDLTKRIVDKAGADVTVRIDGKTFDAQDFQYIQMLPDILKENQAIGKFKLGNIELTVERLIEYQDQLINLTHG